MKPNDATVKLRWATLLLVLSPMDVFSHIENGIIQSPPDAMAAYTVICSDGDKTTRLEAQVSDVLPKKSPRLMVTVSKNDQSDFAIDPVDGDSKYSNFAEVQQGEGNYMVWVSKLPSTPCGSDATREAQESFVMQFHCMTGNNPAALVHTTTDIMYNSKPGPLPFPDPENCGSNPNPSPSPGPTPGIPSAKLQSAGGSLGKNVTQARYLVRCSANKAKQDTVRYKFKIKAASKNRDFGVQVAVRTVGGDQEVVAQDLLPGDKDYSELMSLDGGNASYELVVSKVPGAGDTQKSMQFGIQHVCETAELTRGKLKGPNKTR